MNRLSLWALFIASGMLCQADVILSMSPSSQTAALGSQVNVALDISGLGNGTSLGTYDINVGFNPSLLSYSSIAFGSQLNVLGLGDIQNLTPGTGAVEIFELSLDSPSDLNRLQAPSFTLATLTLDTAAAGANSPVTLSINALGDAYGNAIAATTVDGSVTIGGTSSVPEPSTLPMLCVATLALLMGFRRRLTRG